MEIESTTIIIALIFCVITFLVMLMAFISSLLKRRILQKENEIQRVERQKQIDLFHATAKAEEKLKTKIASDLHDEIVPVMAFMARSVNRHISELEKKGLDLSDLKDDVESFSTISDRVREIAHVLIPKLFTSNGFFKSLEVFTRQTNEGKGAEVEFNNNTTFGGEPPFSKDDQLLIYRICVEILNNLAKHTEYNYLRVTLEDMKENFCLVFAHDGKGITNAEIAVLRDSSAGAGLKSLESRVLLLNAQLDYYMDGGVSYVKLTVPLKHEDHSL